MEKFYNANGNLIHTGRNELKNDPGRKYDVHYNPKKGTFNVYTYPGSSAVKIINPLLFFLQLVPVKKRKTEDSGK